MKATIIGIHGLSREKTSIQSDTCLVVRSKINGLLLNTPFLEKTVIEIFPTETLAQEAGLVTSYPYIQVSFLDKHAGNAIAELLTKLGYPIYATPIEFGIQPLQDAAPSSLQLANAG